MLQPGAYRLRLTNLDGTDDTLLEMQTRIAESSRDARFELPPHVLCRLQVTPVSQTVPSAGVSFPRGRNQPS